MCVLPPDLPRPRRVPGPERSDRAAALGSAGIPPPGSAPRPGPLPLRGRPAAVRRARKRRCGRSTGIPPHPPGTAPAGKGRGRRRGRAPGGHGRTPTGRPYTGGRSRVPGQRAAPHQDLHVGDQGAAQGSCGGVAVFGVPAVPAAAGTRRRGLQRGRGNSFRASCRPRGSSVVSAMGVPLRMVAGTHAFGPAKGHGQGQRRGQDGGMDIGELIRDLRTAHGWSRARLADEINSRGRCVDGLEHLGDLVPVRSHLRSHTSRWLSAPGSVNRTV